MDFEFVTRHRVLTYPEYWFELDEYRKPSGEQLLLAHLRVVKFSKEVLKRIMHEWKVFRSCVHAPIFATAEQDDAKWQSFVELLGFRFLREVACNNGETRRLFISDPQDKDVRLSTTVNQLQSEPVGTAGSSSYGSV